MKGSINALNTIDVHDYVLNRSSVGKYALPWIYSILVNHGHYVISQEHVTQVLWGTAFLAFFIIYLLYFCLTT